MAADEPKLKMTVSEHADTVRGKVLYLPDKTSTLS